MRLMIIAVLALGACGQSPQKPEASAADAAPVEMSGAVRASGTEPFWSLAISPQDGLVLTEAGAAGATEPYVAPAAIAFDEGSGEFLGLLAKVLLGTVPDNGGGTATRIGIDGRGVRAGTVRPHVEKYQPDVPASAQDRGDQDTIALFEGNDLGAIPHQGTASGQDALQGRLAERPRGRAD